MNRKFRMVLLTLLFFVVALITGKVLADNLAEPTEEGKINVNKTAVVDPTNNRRANVTLSIGGNKITKTKTLDVVLVIDRSTSMNDPVSSGDSQTRMEATKVAADSLVTKLLSNNTTDEPVVKMGIVTFGTDVIESYRRRVNYNSYETVYTTSSSLSGNATEVKTIINNIPNNSNDLGIQWTNVQSGIEKAGELLENSDADERIIILLSDGEPNRFNYNGKLYGKNQSDSRVCVEGTNPCTKYLSAAEAAIETAASLKTETTTTKAITIYTIGYGLGNDTTTKNFLKEVATSEKHAFVADKTSELEGKFNDIVQDITTIASNAVVTDVVPNGFTLDETAIKELYGDKVTITKNVEDGTTNIEWNIGNIQSIKTEELSYSVVAKDDYYGGMYTNVSAILEAKTKDNPAYPSGNVEEVFPKPIVPISVKTNNDSYSAKLGENLVVSLENGILKNDSDIKMTDGDGTTVSNQVVIKSASCGNKSDITMNNDGTFIYVPNSVCYTGDNSEVVFEYEVKSTVTINGEETVVTSNVSTITIDLSKDDSTIENPVVTKTNNDGETTTSITDAFSYTIEYSAIVENHIGSTIVTIVDELPYELDETKTNELAGGTYNASNKTITWVETIENINSFENENNEINIEKVIKVYYKNVPTDVDKIVNSVNVTTDIDNVPVNDSEETIVVRGNVLVEYVDTTGNKLLDDKTSKGLIGATYETEADNTIMKNNEEYVLVATKVNGTEVTKTNNYSGEYKEKDTTVTYVYYKVTGDIDEEQTVFTKEGPEKVTSSDGVFNYTITYKSKIDNYIGNATVTIVDTLPYELDETKTNELAGGVYNASNKTITWVINLNDINTYEDGTYAVNVKKEIKVVFKGLVANERTLINKVDAKLETTKSSVEDKTEEETKLEIKGQVVAHYVDVNNQTLVDDVETTGLVGNDYVTSAKNINGYKLVETKGNSTGKYIDGTIEVTYVYYKVEGTVSDDSVRKTGTEEVTSTDATFEYAIKYEAIISDYIGDATVTIVDTLPYELDETKANELNGGVYSKENKTITWTDTIEGIDTNKNGVYSVAITKNIKVSYSGLEATTRKVINSVTGTIKTTVGEKTTTPDEVETAVKVSGNVIAHYVDTDNNKLVDDVKTTGLVGDAYATTAKTITGYQLVETKGETSGNYTVSDIEVTYVYYKITGGLTDNSITKNGTEEVTSTDATFEYTITYNTKIDNYIGDAVVTIVDTLPYELDETKINELDGGVYSKENKTITWTETIEGIDTNTNGEKVIEITKNIKVSYSGLEATTRKITNSVTGTIKTTVGEKTTDPVEKETLVSVSGEVIAHYVDTNGTKLVDDVKTTGLVGNDYVTTEKNITGYELVKTKGETTGKYIDGVLEVTYVYYMETGEITGDEVIKTGTEEVTSTDAIFEYTIKYNAVIKNYIGNAVVTITDTLPLPIDKTKTYELDGGVYDEESKTITWTETIEGIDTNKNGNYAVQITKSIKVSYSGLEATTRKVVNTVVGNISTDITEKTTTSDEAETAVKVSGKVIAHYVDTNGKKLVDDVISKDLVGNTYLTLEKEIAGYELVKVEGETTGLYTKEDIEVTYVYYKITGDIINEELEKNGDQKITISNGKVNYDINYNSEINNYIGNAVVTIVDYLPYELDLTESLLDGGKYDEETRTITWVIDINGIDTYTNGVYKFEVIKNLVLKYKDIDLTSAKLTNKVSVNIKTDVSDSDTDDEFSTDIDVKGFVKVNYVDELGNKLLDTINLTGKVGTDYLTKEEIIMDYILVEIIGDAEGVYVDGILEVTYVYAEIGKGGDVEILPPQTGVKENNNFIVTMFMALLLFIKNLFN